MPDAVMEARHKARWGEPVWVKVGYGAPEAVRGPSEAVSYLISRWPAERDHIYYDAERRCKLALRNEVECEVARVAFIRAAQEARMMA
jgi:hypothetical protein